MDIIKLVAFILFNWQITGKCSASGSPLPSNTFISEFIFGTLIVETDLHLLIDVNFLQNFLGVLQNRTPGV